MLPLCPNCKVSVAATAKFCQECGASLQDNPADKITGVQRRPAFLIDQPQVPNAIRQKMEAAHENLAGTRRLVTIMFADVQGFTTLCESLDPEQVTDLMNKYLGRLGEVVYEFEGYVDKFMGDCIMALFGAPIAHENDPELAIRAALKMLTELEKLNQQHRLTLGIRIGINSGMVVAGGVGTNRKFDFTVMGDAVNIAQRLQTVADPNTIVVGKSVARSSQSVFDFKALEQKKLKGKTELVEAFEVQGFRKRPIAAKGVRDANLKLIGRDAEVGFFIKALQELQEHEAKPFVITAPAGMGKSRLKLELKNMAEQLKVRWIEVRGNPLKSQSTYGVMRSIVQSLLSEFIKIDSKKGRPILESLEELELDDIQHLFLELFLDLPRDEGTRPKIDAQQLKRATFVAIKALIEQFAKREPFVIFVDDLQSVDVGSIEILEFVADASKSCLICGAIRSDDNALSSKFRVLPVNALQADQVLEMARGLLKSESLPTAVAKILTTKSQGIPLFVEELLKSLMESGQLVQRNTSWDYVQNDREVALPDSIQSLILARIDRIYPSDRKVLEYCAVIGRQFSDRLLRLIVGTQAPLQESLQFLRKRELIFEVSVGAKEVEYVFNHLVTQEVVYQSILVKNRKEMHSEVAAAFEKLLIANQDNPDEFYLQQVAYHYSLAEEEEKGFEYLKIALELRRKKFQLESALALLQWSEKYFQSKRAQLLELSGEILDELGHFDRAFKIWNELLLDTDIRLKAVSTRRLADLSRKQNQTSEARRYLELGESFRPGAQSPTIDFEFEKSWANVLRNEAKWDEALARLERALRIATTLKEPLRIAETLNDLGALFLSLQDHQSAETSFLKAFQMAKELREPSIFIRVVMNLGSVFFVRKEWDTAIKHLSRAVKMAEAISDPINRLLGLHNLGLAYSKKLQFDSAKKCFQLALDLSLKLALPKHRWANELHLAYLDLKEKGREYGEQKFRALLSEFAKSGQWMMFGEGVTLLSHYFRDFGDADMACIEIERAIQELAMTNEESVKARLKSELERISQLRVKD